MDTSTKRRQQLASPASTGARSAGKGGAHGRAPATDLRCRDCGEPLTDDNSTASYRKMPRCRTHALEYVLRMRIAREGRPEPEPDPVVEPEPEPELELEVEPEIETAPSGHGRVDERSPIERYRDQRARDPAAPLWHRILYTPVEVEG